MCDYRCFTIKRTTREDGDDREYRGLIQDFADWCLRNNLQINAGKTKELVVDFHAGVVQPHSPPAPVSIQGTDIDTVKSYNLLGQQHHGQGQEENGQTGEEGQLCPGMPPGLSGGGGKRRRMMAKLSSLLNNTSHPLQDTLTALGSSFSERLLHPRCVKERYDMKTTLLFSNTKAFSCRTQHSLNFNFKRLQDVFIVENDNFNKRLTALT
ncbi:hypothetical protein L3Q82_007467 [Scortum barcoo]|uniref:Uncharacterized protein n=1 Tax=Scortum barcoo TaxID=214431 RepID=A0ACB8WRP7_9TELE|nr:hypothetical protein L3Q82_007467 [Scortum barcoo]